MKPIQEMTRKELHETTLLLGADGSVANAPVEERMSALVAIVADMQRRMASTEGRTVLALRGLSERITGIATAPAAAPAATTMAGDAAAPDAAQPAEVAAAAPPPSAPVAGAAPQDEAAAAAWVMEGIKPDTDAPDAPQGKRRGQPRANGG